MAHAPEYPRVEQRSLSTLKAHPDGVRTNDPAAEHILRKQIERWGIIQFPLLNARTGNVLDGDLLILALRASGDPAREIPVLVIDVPEEEEDAVHLARNNHFGEWQWNLVSELLKRIATGGHDTMLTGFAQHMILALSSVEEWAPEMTLNDQGDAAAQQSLL